MRMLFVDVSRRALGTEQHFATLAAGCHGTGHEVVAIVREGSDVADILESYGVDVRRVRCRGGVDPRLLKVVWRCARTFRPEWMITNRTKLYWPLYLLARLIGCRIAAFKHIINIGRWHVRVLLPMLLDAFFVVSDYAVERAIAAGVSQKRLRRLYNPIDLAKFSACDDSRAHARARLGIPREAFVVGFVGRHCDEKGADVLVETLCDVMPQREDVYALWVGDGPDRERTIESLQRRTGLARHRLVDWTKTPEHYYSAMDCLVAPSRIQETFGRVVVEAQACAVPVIAMAQAGMVEAFAPGVSGVPIYKLDTTTLGTAILALRDDPALRSQFSVQGMAFASRFEMHGIADTFVKTLERV